MGFWASLFSWGTLQSALIAAAISVGTRVAYHLLSDKKGLDPRERERWQPQTPRSPAEVPRRVIVGRARVGAINVWYRVDRAAGALHSLWIVADADEADNQLGIVEVEVDSYRVPLAAADADPLHPVGANRREEIGARGGDLDVVFDGSGEQIGNTRLREAGFEPDGLDAPNTIEGVAWLLVTQRNPLEGSWKNRGLPEVFATVQRVRKGGDGSAQENPAALAGWWLARHSVNTDAASLAAAEAACAEMIVNGDGQAVARFRCGGMIESIDPFWRVVRAFEEAMDGRILIGGDGLARFYAGVASQPTAFLIEDTVGAPTVQHEGRRREQRNILRARIRAHSDPRRRGTEVTVERRVETSIEKIGEWAHDAGFLRLVAHEGQARRLLASQLRRSQRPIVVAATLPETFDTVRMRAWQRGSVHLDALGARGPFRLLADPKWNRRAGTVAVELIEDPTALYSDSEDATLSPRNEPSEEYELPPPENLRADADAVVQHDGTVSVQTEVEWDPPPKLARWVLLQLRRPPSTVWGDGYSGPAAGPALLTYTPPGQALALRARFFDPRGRRSEWSEILSFTPGGDLQPPAVPENLTAEPLSETTALVTWKPPSDPDYARAELFAAEADAAAPNAEDAAAPRAGDSGNAGEGIQQGVLTLETGAAFVWARALDHSGNKSAWIGPVLARAKPPATEVDVQILYRRSRIRPQAPPDLPLDQISQTDWMADFNSVGALTVGVSLWQANRTVLLSRAAVGADPRVLSRSAWQVSLAVSAPSLEEKVEPGNQRAFSNEAAKPLKPIYQPGEDDGWAVGGPLTKWTDQASGVLWYGNDRCDGTGDAKWVVHRTATKTQELIEGDEYTPPQHDATPWSEVESYTRSGPGPQPQPKDLPEILVGETKTFTVGENPFADAADSDETAPDPSVSVTIERESTATATVSTAWQNDILELSITGGSVGVLVVRVTISAPQSGRLDEVSSFRVRVVAQKKSGSTVKIDGVPDTLNLRPGETRDEDFTVQPAAAVTRVAAIGSAAAMLTASLPDNDGGARRLRIAGEQNRSRKDREAVVTVTAELALDDGSTARDSAEQTVTLEPDPWITLRRGPRIEFEPEGGVHYIRLDYGPKLSDRTSRFEVVIASGDAASTASVSIDQYGAGGRKLDDALRLVLNDNRSGRQQLSGSVRVWHRQTYQGTTIRRSASADLLVTVKPGEKSPKGPGIHDLPGKEEVAVGETKTVTYEIEVAGGVENLTAGNLAVSVPVGAHRVTVQPDPAPAKGATRSFRVTGVQAGSATVTVTLTDNEGQQVSEDCVVEVTGPAAPSCSGLPERVTLTPGVSRRLAFTVANASSVAAAASNANVWVDQIYRSGANRSFYLRWKKAGSATVTVTVTGAGGRDTCLIAVTLEPRTGPSCSGLPERVTLAPDESRRLAFTVSNAASVAAAASNSDVQVGQIYGSGANRSFYLDWKRAGSAWVTVRVAGAGGQVVSCRIEVTLSPRPIDLPSSDTLRVGQSRTYSITVASRRQLRVETSKSGIVRASLRGGTGDTRRLTVEALAVGVVDVTVTAAGIRGGDPSSDTVTITVEKAVLHAEISGLKGSFEMDVGETDSDSFTVRNTSGVSVSSAARSIATASVSGSGSSRTLRVTGKKRGRTTVTVTAAGTGGGRPAEEDRDVEVTTAAVPDAEISGLDTSVTLDVDETDSDRFTVRNTSGVSVSSAARSIATASVSGSGSSRTLRVTGKAGGRTTVTVTARGRSGGEDAEEDVDVTVNAPTVLDAEIRGLVSRLPAMDVGESETDGFTIRNASRVTVHGWDRDIARASLSGSGSSRTLRVTGVSAGDTTVTVTAYGKNGGANAAKDVEVTVNPPPNPPPTLTALSSAYALKTYPDSGYSITEYYSVSPTSTTVSVSSSNTSLVKIRQNDTTGTTRNFSVWAAGQRTGRATVTVTARANGKTTTRRILATVAKPGTPDPDPDPDPDPIA